MAKKNSAEKNSDKKIIPEKNCNDSKKIMTKKNCSDSEKISTEKNRPETIGALDVLELMRVRAGRSADSVSLELSRARNWFRNLRHGDPMLSTVASVASITGHELAIVDSASGEIVATIAPPPTEERKRLGPGKAKGKEKPQEATRGQEDKQA